jgi:hypothetical protein
LLKDFFTERREQYRQRRAVAVSDAEQADVIPTGDVIEVIAAPIQPASSNP